MLLYFRMVYISKYIYIYVYIYPPGLKEPFKENLGLSMLLTELSKSFWVSTPFPGDSGYSQAQLQRSQRDGEQRGAPPASSQNFCPGRRAREHPIDHTKMLIWCSMSEFWYPPCSGPWNQNVRSLCLCGPWAPMVSSQG